MRRKKAPYEYARVTQWDSSEILLRFQLWSPEECWVRRKKGKSLFKKSKRLSQQGSLSLCEGGKTWGAAESTGSQSFLLLQMRMDKAPPQTHLAGQQCQLDLILPLPIMKDKHNWVENTKGTRNKVLVYRRTAEFFQLSFLKIKVKATDVKYNSRNWFWENNYAKCKLLCPVSVRRDIYGQMFTMQVNNDRVIHLWAKAQNMKISLF